MGRSVAASLLPTRQHTHCPYCPLGQYCTTGKGRYAAAVYHYHWGVFEWVSMIEWNVVGDFGIFDKKNTTTYNFINVFTIDDFQIFIFVENNAIKNQQTVHVIWCVFFLNQGSSSHLIYSSPCQTMGMSGLECQEYTEEKVLFIDCYDYYLVIKFCCILLLYLEPIRSMSICYVKSAACKHVCIYTHNIYIYIVTTNN
jgi:hypothetical protein